MAGASDDRGLMTEEKTKQSFLGVDFNKNG